MIMHGSFLMSYVVSATFNSISCPSQIVVLQDVRPRTPSHKLDNINTDATSPNSSKSMKSPISPLTHGTVAPYSITPTRESQVARINPKIKHSFQLCIQNYEWADANRLRSAIFFLYIYIYIDIEYKIIKEHIYNIWCKLSLCIVCV